MFLWENECIYEKRPAVFILKFDQKHYWRNVQNVYQCMSKYLLMQEFRTESQFQECFYLSLKLLKTVRVFVSYLKSWMMNEWASVYKIPWLLLGCLLSLENIYYLLCFSFKRLWNIFLLYTHFTIRFVYVIVPSIVV